MKDKVKILDCTLRDGGYYNDWNFSPLLVEKYLRAMEYSGVDIVELGFRFKAKTKEMGPYAFTSEGFLRKLKLSEKLKYAVMINFKDFQDYPSDIEKELSRFFVPKKNSKISIVRIAVSFHDAKKTKNACLFLKKMGYEVYLNLMQSNNKSEKEIKDTCLSLSKWKSIDVLYFADSLGNMTPRDVTEAYKKISKYWKGSIGFHSHNNKGLAFVNTLELISQNIDFCDTTMLGMGRGAGNASTESILMELNSMKVKKTNFDVLQASLEDFEKLRKKYSWGSNAFYHFAANNNIHPTYVQTMQNDSRYNSSDIFDILQRLSFENSSSFSASAIIDSTFAQRNIIEGDWDPKDFFKNENVILLGGGPSIKKYRKKILDISKKNNAKLVFLNHNKYISSSNGDLTIVSHPLRAIIDSNKYSNISHPVVMPLENLKDVVLKDHLKGLKTLNYGLNKKKNSFKVNKKSMFSEWEVVNAYALGIIYRSNPRKIFIAGFDGFPNDFRKQNEIEKIFQKYKSLKNSKNLYSITPTSHPKKLIKEI